jgi:uncharacterized protein DUF732
MSYQQGPTPGFGQPPHFQPRPAKRSWFRRHPVWTAVIGVVLLIVVITATTSKSPPRHPAAATTPSTPAAAQPVAQSSPSTPRLSPGDASFVAAVRAHLSAHGFQNTSTDQQVAAVGNSICTVLASGAPHRLVAADLGSKPKLDMDMSGLKLVGLANKDICPAARPKAPPSVTYVVTGTSGAQVTYGPAGSDFTGYVPMRITKPLGSPAYYAINAQLQGGGQVSCEILVSRKVISSSTAQGGYNIADCEIGQDPITGQWENDNSG